MAIGANQPVEPVEGGPAIKRHVLQNAAAVDQDDAREPAADRDVVKLEVVAIGLSTFLTLIAAV